MNQTLLQICHLCPTRRETNLFQCPIDAASMVAHAESEQCSLGRYAPDFVSEFKSEIDARELANLAAGSVPLTDIQKADLLAGLTRPLMQDSGPAIWREIHTCTDPTPAFIDSVVGRLSCGECRQGAVAYLAANPPDYQNWFEWAWKFHNSVNRKLGHPEVGLDEAAKIWK